MKKLLSRDPRERERRPYWRWKDRERVREGKVGETKPIIKVLISDVQLFVNENIGFASDRLGC